MTGSRSYRVLLVEDEDSISMLTEDMLAELGYQVDASAANLNSGLQAATNGIFDAALLEINLKGVLSYPIADVLIERGIPFIFTSGYAAKRHRSAATQKHQPSKTPYL